MILLLYLPRFEVVKNFSKNFIFALDGIWICGRMVIA
jgi:hypothetical protein